MTRHPRPGDGGKGWSYVEDESPLPSTTYIRPCLYPSASSSATSIPNSSRISGVTLAGFPMYFEV